MRKLSAHIKIGSFVFNSVVGVDIESSWDTFTDTCKLTIPRRARWKGKNIFFGDSNLISVADKVEVNIGYGDVLSKAFSGFVQKVGTKAPIEIHCQDKMFELKKNPVTASFKNVKLNTLLSTVLPSDVPFSAPDVSLGPFRISNATPVKVLDVLKKDYFLKSFFRDNKLYVGFAYVPELQKEHEVVFQRDVVLGSNNLIYQRGDDLKIKLKMISISNAQKIEYEAGDQDGEQRTKYYYDYSLSDMKAIADDEIKRLKYTGYKGDVTVFGGNIKHGDVVNIKDEKYKEREGRYLVKKVATSFGVSGFRQTLYLDSKI